MRPPGSDMRHLLITLFLFSALAPARPAQDVLLPKAKDSLRFAVIGDNGTGKKPQYEVADQMEAFHRLFPFSFVIMLGDNLYGGESPKDYEKKFERPYKYLLEAGVKFYASLGNHDDTNQRFYKNFNMNGERYHAFEPRRGVRFFALDSNYMSKDQLEWLEDQLAKPAEWKICFMHHPLYSSGKRHGPEIELRGALEPLFTKYGVNAVFSGHEHFYERIKPQHGVHYFISGAAGQLRRGNLRESPITAKGFDQDRHFMLVEIAGNRLHFQAIDRTGKTVDSGAFERMREMPFAGASVPAAERSREIQR